jgi:hypothetical protein
LQKKNKVETHKKAPSPPQATAAAPGTKAKRGKVQASTSGAAKEKSSGAAAGVAPQVKKRLPK